MLSKFLLVAECVIAGSFHSKQSITFSSPNVSLLSSHCEYLEEFPLQALPQLSSLSGHKASEHGLIVVLMQYGKKKIDYLGRSRAETDWTKAWKSNFLHPVLYFYDSLPTGEYTNCNFNS